MACLFFFYSIMKLFFMQDVIKSILFLLFTSLSLSLTAQISGVVLDANNGDALIGVSVSLQDNNSVGTITDIDGSFTINANAGDMLVFSYVGYERLIVEATEAKMNINLQSASELIDEVVVLGYGSSNKKDLTGVVAKVNEDDFITGTINSPERLLQGKVAGLQIATSSEPGGASNIQIRGTNSLGASTAPLFVIDGVPLDNRGVSGSRNPLNFINANEIESMTILKDASAAAIYGSRAAGGVIIITTKSGKSGKPQINYSGNVNASLLAGRPNNLNYDNFLNAISAKAPQELEFLGDANTDWVKEVTQIARSTEHNLSISGGTKSLDYRVYGGYLKNNGVLLTSENEIISGGANLNFNLFKDQLKLRFSNKTGLTNDRFVPGVMGAALTFDPTRPVLDEDSPFGGYYQWEDPLAVNNPVSSLLLTNERGVTLRTLNSAGFTYNLPFLEGLSLNSDVSYDHISGDKLKIEDPLLKDNESFNRGGFYFDEDFRNYTAQIETYGSYNFNLPVKNSKISLTAGHSWLETDQENRWTEGRSLEFLDDDSVIPTTDIQVDSFLTANRLISFFGRTNVTLYEKYLLTASVRADGSSRFGDSNKWGYFPSAALAWRVLEEDWDIGLLNNFSDLKLRLSYGGVGNQDLDGDFLYKTFYSLSQLDASYQFGDEFVQTLRGVGVDPNIKWESTYSLNFGVDFGILNNRYSGTLDIYQQNTRDLLFRVAAPAFTNLADRILTNIGEMRNRGVELTLNTVPIDRNKMKLRVDFNASYNRNVILKLDNSQNNEDFAGYEDGGISGDIGQTIQILKVGEAKNTFRTYIHKRDENGLPLVDTEDFNGDGLITLLDIYEDVNEDGLINEDDLVNNRNASPDFIFGLSPNFSYGKFDISATLRSHIGNYVYNNVASGSGYFDKLTDRVTNNVDDSAFRVNFKERQLKSDYYIENASFVKLDNVTVGYNIQSKFFRQLRVYGTVTNLLTITGYSGLDPELPQFTQGIDNNLFPISRNFLLGVRAGF